MAFDRLQTLAVYIEDAYHLVCASREDELLVVDHDTPYWTGMTREFGRHTTLFDIPDKDLAIPSTADDFAAVLAEGQARDIAGVSDEHTVRIRIWFAADMLDEDECLSSTSCYQAVRVCLRGWSVCEAVEPMRAL